MMELSTRERFVRTLTGQEVDRVPFMKIFGGTNGVLGTWKKAYPLLDQYIDELLGFEGGYRGWRITPVNFWLDHLGEPEVLFEDDKERLVRHGDGTLKKHQKNNDYHHHIVEYPVKTQNDWDRIRSKHLNPLAEERMPPHWPHLCELYQNRTFPLQLTCGGVYGFLRNMMGDEALCYAMYDDPDLVRAITSDYVDMLLILWERLCRDVSFDLIETWEDMAGKGGSIISPAHFEEFLAPQFRRISDFAKQHHIRVFLADSDGYTDLLAHQLFACGVNALYPFEVGAGCDPLKVLTQIPGMGALGCLEKNACALGSEAIEQEMEKARALIRKGRCIPGPDHFVLQNVPFEGYKLFMNRLREVVLTTKPG